MRGMRRSVPALWAAGVPAAVAITVASAVAGVMAASAAQAQQASATGEVRRVDAAAGTVTIKHDEIKGLGLPAMTLVYQAAPALLGKIKAGDKVRFTASRQAGKYVVTAIDKAVF